MKLELFMNFIPLMKIQRKILICKDNSVDLLLCNKYEYSQNLLKYKIFFSLDHILLFKIFHYQ